MDILKVRALYVVDTRDSVVVDGGRWLRSNVLPFKFVADPAQRVWPDGSVVKAGIRVSSE